MAVDSTTTPRGPSPLGLSIAIIGAGMGGLGCALALAKKGFKDIQVYETASSLGFVGAGIQMAPNMVRILSRWDCWDNIAADSTEVFETSIRDGATDRELTHVEMGDIRDKFGYPHCLGHRASLAAGLYEGCQKEPAIAFHFGHSLVSVDSFSPRPTFTVQSHDGSTRQATVDVLIAADGVKSITRSMMLSLLGYTAEAESTGQAAYRVMLPREKMEADPEMMALLDSNQVVRWIGERRHWIAYPIHGKKIYNMSSTQPDVNFQAPSMSATYTTKGSKAAMLGVFDDFCPLVKRMLDLVPDGEVCEWKLHVHKPLPTWTHGSVALLGDACHPTLPHLSQGAAMAIEDAAVLAEVLSRVPLPPAASSPSTDSQKDTAQAISRALVVYEELRKQRTSTLVDMAAFSGRTLHLGEGKAKEERDRQFAEAKKNGGSVPDKWASPDVQKMIYSHDCMQVAAERFQELYSTLSKTAQ